MHEADRKDLISSVVLALLSGIGASFLFAAVALLISGSATASEAAAEPAPSSHSGTLHVRTVGGQVIRNVPRLRTDVQIAVSGMLARVRVKQRFINPSPEWVEAVYVFPLPDDSAVDHMRMLVADRLIEGEIQERAQARRTYEQARASGQRASLLEQERDNIFTTSLANIPPGEEILVEIEYQQAVQHKDGLFSLRFPMVVGPRYIPGTPIVEQTESFDGSGWGQATTQVPDAARITPPIIDQAIEQSYENPVALNIELDAGMPVEALQSPYHAVDVQVLDPARRRISLTDGEVRAERDFLLQWRLAGGAVPSAALFQQTRDDGHYGLLMINPPAAAEVDAGALPPRELVLVVDTSGSMHGDSIEQARAALHLALAQLRPQDRFNLIQFSDRMDVLFPQAVNADAENLQRARRYVDALQAEGGTEMEPAMRYALQQGASGGLLRQVVFLTDGDIGNEQQLFDTIRAHLGASRLFPVGIGSAPNSYFMTRAAGFGRGSFTFIGKLEEVNERMQGLFNRLSKPVLTDVQLSWFDEQGQQIAVQQAPQLAPDVYAGEPLLLSVRSERKPARVLIRGQLGNAPWQREVTLRGGADAEAVHVLWARRMIDDWMARRWVEVEEDKVRSEVLSLALRHHLVSPYTSLVAVDKTPARPVEDALHSKPMPTHLPAGWSQAHVAGMPQTATPAQLLQILGIMLLLGAGLLYRRWA